MTAQQTYQTLDRISALLRPFNARLGLDDGELAVVTQCELPAGVLQALDEAWPVLEEGLTLLEIQRLMGVQTMLPKKN